MDETNTAATPDVAPSTTAAAPDVDPSTTTPAAPQQPSEPDVATPQPQQNTPVESACLAAVSDVPFGERAQVVVDGQTYVAWLDGGVNLCVENRGIA